MENRNEVLHILEDKTCLSPKVFNILCDRGIQDNENTDVKHIFEDDFISWLKVKQVLPEHKTDSYSYFEECVIALAPSFLYSQKYFDAISPDDFVQRFHQLLDWTTLPQTLQRCYTLLKCDIPSSQTLALLFIMPVFERSLGDVYLLKGRQCPSMLKDLLVKDELKEILGVPVVELLRVLIGPPISLNLRNVTWHGFPSPEELSPRYGYFMMHIILSIGKLLDDKSLAPKHRKMVKFPQVARLANIFPDVFTVNKSKVKQLISQSSFVMKRMEAHWLYAVDCFYSQRYLDSVVLLLPQLEHGLRRVFAVVNRCPERLLTAENTVLFTTFDEILTKNLPDGSENQLRYHIGDGRVTVLLDLLFYPDGPRLRDRLSHGETNLLQTDSEWKVLANHILSFVISLCLLYIPTQVENIESCAEQVFSAVTLATHMYSSIFHPLSLLVYQVKEVSHQLSNWFSFDRPAPNEVENDSFLNWMKCLNSDQEFENSDGYNAGLYLVEHFKILPKSSICLVKPFADITASVASLCDIEVKTLYRNTALTTETNKEEEVIGLLRRILSETSDISRQVNDCCQIKYKLWKTKQLRSRQRDTYRRMINSIPKLSVGLRVILLVVLCHLHMLEKSMHKNLTSAKCIRLLKFILQYCENVKGYSHPDRNRWEESEKYTDSLLKRCSTLE